MQDVDQQRRLLELERQRHQVELLRLETEKRQLLLEVQKTEAARQGVQLPHVPSAVQPSNTQVPPPRTKEENFRRTAKQLGFFFAGAGFLTASALISRRAVARRMVDSYPKFYQPSHYGPRPPPRASTDKGEDQLVAVEALGLATLNVFSFGIMLTGGLMFAFDISNLEDLRWRARKQMYGGDGVVDEAAEQQIEEWIADVLSRRDKPEDEAAPQNKSG